MIRKSGADYAYIMETFGPFLAFIRLWIECMIVRPCSQAIVSLTFSVYVLKPFYPDCTPPDESVRLLAVCCISEYAAPTKQPKSGHFPVDLRCSFRVLENYLYILPRGWLAS